MSMSDLSPRLAKRLGAGFDSTHTRSEEELLRLRTLARENQILLDTVLVGIVFVRDRMMLRCNRRFEELFGYAPHELDGRSTRVLYPDEAAFSLGGSPYPALAEGKTHQREQILVRKDGSPFWCRLYGRAMDPAHPHDGSVWLFEDVSERKAAEEANRQLLLHYRAIFENASAGIVFTRRGICETCNPQFAALFGYASPEAVTNQPASVLYRSSDDYCEMGRLAEPVLARGEPLDVEWQMRRADGALIWVRLHAQAVGGGDLSQGTIWIAEDISERRRAEQVLQQTLMEQEAILENASVGIVFLKDRVVQRCNRRFAELFGYAPGAVLGQTTRFIYASDEDFQRSGAEAYAFLARGQSHTREQHLVRRDGSRFWCRVTGRSVDLQRPGQESVWLAEDVTEQHAAREDLEARVQQRTAELADANRRLVQEIAEREQAESRVRHLANHDELSGLPNRRLLFDRLTLALALARRAGELVAVVFLDLDRFKTINDSLGHAVGDELLRSVAQRLAGVVREGDTVARLGGDEFVLVLPQLSAANHVVTVAEKVVETLSLPFHVHGHELHITASLGMALFPGDGDSPETLLRNADSAMYHAKEAGRDNYQFFASQMNVSAAMRLELENDLHHALQRDELFLEYQPRIDVQHGHMKGVEALVRWQHPRLGVLYPGRFIPLAEETGLITRLGEWVLHRACRQVLAWQQQGAEAFPVAVNLSPRQFRQHDIVERISAILTDTGVSAQLIELEITESTLMQHTDQTTELLLRLRAMGLSLAIDDFGIGYSNLSYLKRLPVAQLKIDQSFVRDLAVDPTNAAIVSTVATLANKLGLSVVAEGVETLEQLDLVRRCGCGQAQGFLFSRAVPAEQVLPMLTRDWLAAFDAVPLDMRL
ncbi:MAG: EAL domain-containing protein [Betaproteobacteria bacterium]|nr:MAG: EAL domain-containing protein [Betaproteobacteria bacterium]